MRSRLFECRVMHQRFIPRGHRFDYRIFMLALDLDELPAMRRRSRLLGINRPGFFSIRETDYLPTEKRLHNRTGPVLSGTDSPEKSTTLKHRVIRYLESQGVTWTGGRIELITMPRVAGYRFNPVSFYFCHDQSGQPVAAIAEVTNTFGEVKPFLLDRSRWSDGGFRHRQPKHFYVSPFSDVDVAFDFQLRPADDTLAIKIDDHEGAERTLTSVLTGRARPLRDRTLAWFVLKYPLLTVRVIAAIHWHALRLKLMNLPWFSKAARPGDQRDLYLPHRSLTDSTPARLETLAR